MSYKILAYGHSDKGLVRPNNEDVWVQLPEDQFYVLADGMGGHQAGEIAAREAVNQLCFLFKEKYLASNKTLREGQDILFHTIQQVNQFIYRMSLMREEWTGMGTTLCCLFIHPEGLIYGHVGDSRIYRLRHHKLKQLTQDHSLVRELIDLGQLSENQAGNFLYKNIITKAIGTEPIVDPTVKTDSIHEGDVFLMCTDGLTDMLSQDEIQHIMCHIPASDMALKLIQEAILKGGHDNVTAVIVKIQEKYENSHLS